MIYNIIDIFIILYFILIKYIFIYNTLICAHICMYKLYEKANLYGINIWTGEGKVNIFLWVGFIQSTEG